VQSGETSGSLRSTNSVRESRPAPHGGIATEVATG
jgi:hypothetical protein